MVKIFNTTTKEVEELEYVVFGQDALADVMGNNRAARFTAEDAEAFGVDADFKLAAPDIEWWGAWIELAQRVDEAMANADDDALEDVEDYLEEHSGKDLMECTEALARILKADGYMD